MQRCCLDPGLKHHMAPTGWFIAICQTTARTFSDTTQDSSVKCQDSPGCLTNRLNQRLTGASQLDQAQCQASGGIGFACGFCALKHGICISCWSRSPIDLSGSCVGGHNPLLGVSWFMERSTALTISRLVANAVYSPLQGTHLRCSSPACGNLKQDRCLRHGSVWPFTACVSRFNTAGCRGVSGHPLEWFGEGYRRIRAFQGVPSRLVQTTERMAVWGGREMVNGTACLSPFAPESQVTRDSNHPNHYDLEVG